MLKSFLASVQFYSKFLPPYFSEITKPLYKLTCKGQQWKWGKEEATSFKKIKWLLCTETILAHYDPSLLLGLSCDASECGIGAVLFHCFADGSERPILNTSKNLLATQKHYSQRQSRQSGKHSNAEDSEVVSKVEHHYTLGDPITHCTLALEEIVTHNGCLL